MPFFTLLSELFALLVVVELFLILEVNCFDEKTSFSSYLKERTNLGDPPSRLLMMSILEELKSSVFLLPSL